MGGERKAADVFGLLADETRLDILRAVAVAQHAEKETGVAQLSFSALYDRVGVDNTSKLSYHLGELTGTFLRKDDEGYSFTHAGEQLVRFVLAANHRPPPDIGPIQTAGRCLYCGESALKASLHDQYFVVDCSACDRPAFSYRVRPAQVRSHEGSDLVRAVIWEQAADFLKMRQGVCPDCAGRMTTEVIAEEEMAVFEAVPSSFATLSECQQCLRVLSLPLTHAAAYHPESVAFHWAHDVDIMGTGVWEFHRHLHDGRWTAEREESGPGAYRVALECADTTLRLYLDESAAVTRTEHVRRSNHRNRRS